MRYVFNGREFEVTLPSNPAAFVNSYVDTFLQQMGHQMPRTDTGALRAAASQWEALGARLQGHCTNLQEAINQLAQANGGEGPQAAVNYLHGSESGLRSLQTVAAAAPAIASGYREAAMVIDGLRTYVTGVILADSINITCAIATGGVSAALSILNKNGAKQAIDAAFAQTTRILMGS